MSYNTITQTFAGQAAIGMTCWCSLRFAIPETLYNEYRRRNDDPRDSFELHCPLGHTFVPGGPDPEKARLRRELAEQTKLLDRTRQSRDEEQRMRFATERQLAAQRGVTTKMKKRAGHGVCPVPGCKRHFTNLERHIKGQHPEWQESA